MALFGIPARASLGEMRAFVDKYRADAVTHIPDETLDIWRSLNVGYQPWWAIVRANGTWESGRGFFPAHVISEAVTS